MSSALKAAMDQGWLKPHIGKAYPLKDVKKAHHDVINNKGAQGKLVLKL